MPNLALMRTLAKTAASISGNSGNVKINTPEGRRQALANMHSKPMPAAQQKPTRYGRRLTRTADRRGENVDQVGVSSGG